MSLMEGIINGRRARGRQRKMWADNINQSIHQTSIAPISQAKPGSVVQQPNQCSTAKSREQFPNINRLWEKNSYDYCIRLEQDRERWRSMTADLLNTDGTQL